VNTDSSAIPKAPPGLYWQVTSIADVEAARVFLQTIKDMGLPVTLSPGPNKFTRVLVGPYADTAAMGKVKTQLEHAGMHPVRLNQ
jgi:cell division septation protein DedD